MYTLIFYLKKCCILKPYLVVYSEGLLRTCKLSLKNNEMDQSWNATGMSLGNTLPYTLDRNKFLWVSRC